MTVDMMAAAYFWSEATLLYDHGDLAPDGGEAFDATDRTVDLSLEAKGETFWAGILRQIGWPLPTKPSTAG